MRSRLVLVFAGALLCATAAHGQATDMERFEKKVRKYTVGVFDVFEKPKGLCVCINDPDNPDNNGGAGALDSAFVQTPDATPGQIRVRCMVMKSTAEGEITLAESCEEWVPLAR
jgi:hypothetical protein